MEIKLKIVPKKICSSVQELHSKVYPKKRRRCVRGFGRNRGHSSDALISYAAGLVVPAFVILDIGPQGPLIV